jgi:hypothetical protein
LFVEKYFKPNVVAVAAVKYVVVPAIVPNIVTTQIKYNHLPAFSDKVKVSNRNTITVY